MQAIGWPQRNPEEQALLLPNSDSTQQGSSALEEGQGYGLAFIWQLSASAAPATVAMRSNEEIVRVSCIIHWLDALACIVARRLHAAEFAPTQ